MSSSSSVMILESITLCTLIIIIQTGADIMTVTVVLSSDSGGKMSLFQDLKLKRRKVDSRCSSDGTHT
jgi:hypothetical protein